MNLSDLDPKDVSLVSQAEAGAAPAQDPHGEPSSGQITLADLDPSEVTYVAPSEKQYKYGGLPQQALAGLEAFGRGASLGTSSFLTPLYTTPEAVKSREEVNPGTALAGSLGGAGTLAALTGGFGGLASAGLAGAAAEGGIYGLGNAISDAALGDPHLNAEKVLADVGIGAALGGGLGILGKSIKALPAFLRNPKEVESASGAVSPQQALKDAGLTDVPLTQAEQGAQYGAPRAGNLRESFPIDALDARDQKPVLEGLNHLKSNADEILAAGQKLNAPVPEGMLTADEHIQKIDHALTQSPSPQGVARNRLYNHGYESASKSVSDALGESGSASLAETGNQAKQLLSEAVEAKYEPIKNLYSQIEELAPEVPIKNASSLGKSLETIIEDQSLIKGTPEYGFVKTFAEGLEQVNSLEKLKNYRTALQRATGPETKYVSGLIKDALDNLEVKSIESHASSLEGVAKDQMMGLIDQVKEAKSAYAGFREEIGKVGKLLWGGKRIYGAQDFLDKIEQETPEKFASRLFSKNNSEALQWMSEKFPEITQNLAQFEKSKLRAASLTKGDFSPVKFLNQMEKLSPEVRSILFTPEEQGVFKAGKTYFDNLLPNFNPSGTAGSLQYQEFLKHPVSSALNWAKDFGVGKYIQHEVKLSPEQIKAAQLDSDKLVRLRGISGMANRVSEKITQGAKDVLSSHALRGAVLGGATSLSDQEYDKVVGDVKNFYANPQTLLEDMAQNTESLYDAAPNITQGIHASLARAVSFLGSKIPQPPAQQMFLTRAWMPTPSQRANFNQYYQAVNHPVGAFKQVKSGTLSPQTMEALSAVHPKLLEEMRSQVLQNMKPEAVRKLPYPQKLSLSKFLGQPLDVNMTPHAVQMNQMSLAGSQAKKEAQPQMGGMGKSTLGGLKELGLSKRSAPFTSQRD